MEQQQQLPAYSVVRDASIESIIREDLAIDEAKATLSVRENAHILTFPSLWMNRSSLTKKAAELGWSDAKVVKAEATGFILNDCVLDAGIEPVALYDLVSRAYSKKGSLGENLYKPVGAYIATVKRDGVDPTVSGAMKAIRVAMGPEATTPEERFIESVTDLAARLRGENKRTAVTVTEEVRHAVSELYAVAFAGELVTA